MSQLSFSSFDDALLVRDAQGRYLPASVDQILEAARQAIEQKMQRGAEFTSPALVKEYLRNKLAGFEHEVFAVLFLDTRHRLIEYREMFHGTNNSQVSYGQSRVQVVWNRITLPDTSSLTLDNLAGTDPAGYAGLEDGVDWHWDRIFAGAVLTTLLGVGAELAAPENRQDGDRIIIAGRDSAQDSINQVGQEITRRNMNIQPTLTERPGLPVRIIVNRDLVLRPYQPLFFNRGTSR